MSSKRAWFVETPEEIAATEEMESTSDRAAAIVVASLVDARLTTALQMEMLDDKKVVADLFRTSGPLGSFSAKIDLAYLLQIISEQAYRDLLTMKKIRNLFAHDITPLSFETSPLKDLCHNFRLIELMMCDIDEDEVAMSAPRFTLKITDYREHLSNPRGRYLLTGRLFVAGFDVHDTKRKKSPLSIDHWL
jgi:DNA-binding MltR family transcriptional regulator